MVSFERFDYSIHWNVTGNEISLKYDYATVVWK